MRLFHRKTKETKETKETKNNDMAEHINFFFDLLNEQPANSRQSKFNEIINAITDYEGFLMFDSEQKEVLEKLSLLKTEILTDKKRLEKYGLTFVEISVESNDNKEELLAEYIPFISTKVTTRLTT